MWRPESLGEVMAERVCDLRQADRCVGQVTIRFGRPVRAPHAQPGEPWWCPVRVCGTGIDLFRAIAGEDSLQALILALEFAADIVPHEASTLRPALDWLGQPEAMIVTDQGQSRDPDNAFTALFRRLESDDAGLAAPPASSRTTERPVLRAVGGTVERLLPDRPSRDRRKP